MNRNRATKDVDADGPGLAGGRWAGWHRRAEPAPDRPTLRVVRGQPEPVRLPDPLLITVAPRDHPIELAVMQLTEAQWATLPEAAGPGDYHLQDSTGLYVRLSQRAIPT